MLAAYNRCEHPGTGGTAEARRLLGGDGRLSVVHVHHDPPSHGGMYDPTSARRT